MQFYSFSFLFVFLPIFLAVYFLAGQRWQNPVLLLGSCLFYGIGGGWIHLGLLGLLVAVTYFAGRMMDSKLGKCFFYIVLTMIFGCLLFFKIASDGSFLPLGFSFVSFQLAYYLIWIFRGKVEPETNFCSFAVQMLMFPKLLAGPIMEPGLLAEQVRSRQRKGDNFHEGLQLFLLGLGLKVLLADPVGGIWAQARVAGFAHISPIFAWLALISFAMNLYFDFYGYTVMARGLGLMLGFSLPRNFCDPYRARSVREFYRRWHRSLGLWFRDCVYIPLGGSRAGTMRTVCNILLVWLLTGLWHGVGVNYLLWAAFLGFVIVLERLWLGQRLAKFPMLAHFYTLMTIFFSWIPFAFSEVGEIPAFLGLLLGRSKAANIFDFLFVWQDYCWLLFASAVVALGNLRPIWEKIRLHPLTDWALLALFWLCVSRIATVEQSPFSYFRF